MGYNLLITGVYSGPGWVIMGFITPLIRLCPYIPIRAKITHMPRHPVIPFEGVFRVWFLGGVQLLNPKEVALDV